MIVFKYLDMIGQWILNVFIVGLVFLLYIPRIVATWVQERRGGKRRSRG